MSTPELDYITVTGFKSIVSVEQLELRPINVMIGANGSGKSNFIGVFAFLHALREGRLQDYVAKAGGADKILHFGAKTTSAIEIRISFVGKVNQYEIKLEPNDADELFPSSETVYYWNKKGYSRPWATGLARIGKEAGISDPSVQRTASWVRQRLGSWRVYHFHDTSASSPMKKTADLNDNRFLRPDASNLSAFLYYLQTKHGESYGLIRSTIQRATPFFDDFQLEPSQLSPDKI
ncbi:MAG: AAA family ATPase, partial [Dehalococcoidia bacterium]|nr:AAA family ATPase [Dehalococcoidia bacterium]